jgi:hypothetical protein
MIQFLAMWNFQKMKAWNWTPPVTKNIEQNLKLYVDCGGEKKKKKWVPEKKTQE